MLDTLVRLLVLVLVSLLLYLVIWSGRRYVERQRRAALAAKPPEGVAVTSSATGQQRTATHSSRVQILAFSSTDCQPCHTLQAPALRRLIEARKDDVSVVEIDAPNSPQLTQRYHVLTVPTTVVLDTAGQVHAVNYGFANTQQLLAQVDEVLGVVA
jgi:thioredoxin-like negative regulator of GroEL